MGDVLDNVDEEMPVKIEDLLLAKIFCDIVCEESPDELVAATGEDYNTMPDAVKAKLHEIEQVELEKGAFDKGEIAETICDRIASGEYGEGSLSKRSEMFNQLIRELCFVFRTITIALRLDIYRCAVAICFNNFVVSTKCRLRVDGIC